MNIKVPVSWLREYLKTDVAAKTIANYLSLSGPSVEGIEKRGDDYIFDLEITTNRPDAFSVFGIAREANAILANNNEKSALVNPKGTNLSLDPDITNTLKLDVVLQDPSLCPRFTAVVVDNVKIKSSPAQIKNRLSACGIRPTNNIVDITNYIMLELGQPMHAFDYDKIRGAKMLLRSARENEKITTLDGQNRKLPPGAIVIEDTQRLIDLCGIMGGENSQITKRTKRVVLFVQAYNSQVIRKTTQELAFRTEAAARFEKDIDLEGILPALSRAVYLVKKTADAQIASELIDIYHVKQKHKEVKLNLKKANRYLSINLETAKAAKILTSLGFKVNVVGDQIMAKPPSWRAQDIESDVDLIEEIARIYGYHNLPSKLPEGEVPSIKESDLKTTIDIKKALKFLGLTEIISYSIISKSLLNLSGINQKEAVELANPLTDQWQFMRPTIIPSLIEVVAKNQYVNAEINIFEIAKTYIAKAGSLPKQNITLAIVINKGDFYQIKGIIEYLFMVLNRKPSWHALAKIDSLFAAGESARVKIGDTQIGTFGIINQLVLEQFSIENRVAAAELNVTEMLHQPPYKHLYHPISKYPPVIEDISAIFSIYTPIADIIQTIKKASDLIQYVEAIDIFQDEKIGPDKKSVTLRITYQKASGTLAQEEVTRERNTIFRQLEKSLRAKIRR